MGIGSPVGRLCAIGVLTLAASAFGAAPATAADVTLPAGTVVELAQAGTTLTAPADGRLRGLDFTAEVTGVAWPQSAGVTTRYRADPGDRLVVFTLELTEGTFTPLDSGSNAVSAYLDVAGQTESVDLTDIDGDITGSSGDLGSGTATYVADVPAATHDVDLQMTEGPSSQRLSLWTFKRLAPAPHALYRGADTSAVSSPPAASASLAMSDPGNGNTASVTVVVQSATLGWFAPDPASSTPANLSSAILTVQFAVDAPSGGTDNFYDLSELPGERLTFTPTGASPLPGQLVAVPPAAGSLGLLDGTYWFTVPEATTSGLLTMTPGPVTGTDYNAASGGPSTPLDITSAGSFALTFPPPVTLAAQRTPPWARSSGTTKVPGAPSHQGGEQRFGTEGSSTAGAPLVWVLFAAVVAGAAAAALAVFARRRRRSDAALSDDPPIAVGPDPEPVLSDPPVLAAEVAEPAGGVEEHQTSPAAPAATPAVTVIECVSRPIGDPRDLVVRVLGPIDISGWLEESPGPIAEELCCYLALHAKRPLSTQELAGALWPLELEVEVAPKTVRNHLSRLRAAVGSDRLPDAGGTGYRLDAITDREVFTDWVAQADRADGEAADRFRAGALGLVRGEPFMGVPSTRYSWAFSESLASDMVAAIVSCAHRLSSDRLAAGDSVGAESAARAGLKASPTEEQLWLDAAAAISLRADRPAFDRLVRDAERAAGPDVAERLRGVWPLA